MFGTQGRGNGRNAGHGLPGPRAAMAAAGQQRQQLQQQPSTVYGSRGDSYHRNSFPILVLNLKSRPFDCNSLPIVNPVCELLLRSLTARGTIVHCYEKEQALDQLSNPHLNSVLVVDWALLDNKYRRVLEKLVAFVKRGGTVQFAGSFVEMTGLLSSFFKNTFGLKWEFCEDKRAYSIKNLLHPTPVTASLPDSMERMKVVTITNVTEEEAVYTVIPSRRDHVGWEAVAAITKYGSGYVAFNGQYTNFDNGKLLNALINLGEF
ncbi:hypothetical protein BT69DRAFT_1315772 [Atractiella rhizophila]|nr:hypothetical protein BT69DRAFT_1315772 [Atractiella rhizophila]